MADKKEAKIIEDKIKALGLKKVKVLEDTYNYGFGERYIKIWIADIGGSLGIDIKLLYQDIDDLIKIVEYLRGKK